MNINQYVNRNALKDSIKHTSLCGNKGGYVKVTKGEGNEGDAHRDTKYKVCCELAKRNFEFYTEVEFKKYGRADIVAFDQFGNGFIIEILNTEQFNPGYTEYKKKNYPSGFEFITIKCGQPIKLEI